MAATRAETLVVLLADDWVVKKVSSLAAMTDSERVVQ